MPMTPKFLLALTLFGATAQAHEPAPAVAPALGRIDFPTSSTKAPAQAAFIEGMLLLHLFEYTSAAQSFLRAQQLEPGLALAYWGEAMTYTHPVWNQQDLAAGRAALAKLAPTPEARAAKAGTALERDFLQLTEILYGEGSKPERDLRALAHMEAMAKRYPKDDEVQSFLALSLLGADQGVRNLPRFLRAADIARAVFKRSPQHAGAAHYWIHGMDDPANAAGALEAARALSKIAPGAGHSQHMTSHIFVALGLWDDVVASNVAAEGVVNAQLAAKGRPAFPCGHYTEWLQYAYFQKGREEIAAALLEECAQEGAAAVAWMRAHPGEAYLSARAADRMQENARGSLARMQAMGLVDSRKYGRELLAASAGASSAGLLFARGLAQLRDSDKPAAAASLAALRALADGPAAADDNGSEQAYTRIMARMLEGASDLLSGRAEAGRRTLEQAASDYDAQPFDFGPPATVKPPRELLGEILLAAGHREEAQAEFERALRSAPQRRLGLAGRAQAAASP